MAIEDEQIEDLNESSTQKPFEKEGYHDKLGTAPCSI